MDQEKLEPLQSLQLIESMIKQAKNKLSDNGHLYLLWGWVILICSLGHFAAIKWQLHERPEWIWGLTWVAFLYQTFYLIKHKRNNRVNTYADEILKAVWLVFIGCGVIMGVVVSRNANWETMYPLILMLYGVPTIISGTVLRFKPLIIGGVICWGLSIVASFIPLLYNLLLVSLAVIAAWIIPGYLMRKRFLLENA
ncbi:MAG: hypothetical protein MUE99_01560 [Chitinophagaceae bacterium]|nr:hypothetical protein [Chitinophagaceae bacterium]